MPAIALNDLTFSYSTQPLLQHITMHVGDGERACLVGPNGCGKSTLLNLIAGRITPDSGSVTVQGVQDPDAMCVPQALSFQGSVRQFLDQVLAPMCALATRFEQVSAALADTENQAETSREYDMLLARMSAADVWSVDSRVAEILAGLGLSELNGQGLERPVPTLSPGQRVRLELVAHLALREPVLLLDEPTNHLDVEAVVFLVRLLQDWPGLVVMASHDRAFIDETATVMYDLDIASWQALATATGGGTIPGIYRCAGNYANYLQEKTKALNTHAQLHAAQQAEKHSLRAHRMASSHIARGGVRLAEAEGKAKKFFSDRAAATATKRSRADDQRLHALTTREVRKPRGYRLQLPLEPVPARFGLAVSVRQARVKNRLAAVTFDLSFGEHMLVTGPNGAGKSTLLTWIAQGYPPVDATASGSISRDHLVGAVSQHLPREGDLGFEAETWQSGIGQVGAGLVHPSLWNTPIAKLSAGNQRRAQLALAMAETPRILVIDEPTNYLDLDAMQALEDALSIWNGTLIIASHDRWLIEHWSGRRLCLELPPP